MPARRSAALLGGLEHFGMRLGLERVRALLHALGDPQLAVPAVLVAGTNGKGSTAALLASMCRAAAYRTGLFTSPHLAAVTERLALDGFAAEPGTVSSWEEFRGTGGSLYYLPQQDILIGSERVRIEVRDKDSGLVTGVVHLRPTLDYDIDYLQGRVLLTEPLDATVDDSLLVRTGGLGGDEAWLVVQYEYSPGFDEIDTLAAGGQGHYWFGDFVKLGLTASRNEEGSLDSNLYAGDVTLRASTESWLKLQVGRSEGQVSTALRSDDGGFTFLGGGAPADSRSR